MVTVSIVIPAYNEDRYIGRCIETLLNQSYKNFELIFVDDGSTDRTAAIIRRYKRCDKRIKLLHQKRGGPGRARNLGVQRAQGEIIIFVDADMEFDKEYIRNLIRPVRQKKAIGTFHLQEHVANTQNVWARCWGTKPRTKPTDGTFRAIRKSTFLQVQGFDPTKGTFDDQSIGKKLNAIPKGIPNAICYHHNPTSLSEVYRQIRWIGGSFILHPQGILLHTKKAWKKLSCLMIFLICMILFLATIRPTFPEIISFAVLILLITLSGFVLALTSSRAISEKDTTYLYALPIFYSVWLAGFCAGALKQLFNIFAGGKTYKY